MIIDNKGDLQMDDDFNRNDLQRLIEMPSRPCVSIYMPTYPAGSEGQQDPIRLKNLLVRAEEQLGGHWMRPVEARRLLERVHDLPNDSLFWEPRSRGLAIFVAPDFFEQYRLPLALEESVTVSYRFRIRPVLPLLGSDARFYLLALSQNQVRLFEVTRHEIDEMEVAGLPKNMPEALGYDEVERGSQVHSAMSEHLGKEALVFHGHGGEPDTLKDDLVNYFRVIDAAVTARLHVRPGPLLLACVEYLSPIYRQINSYPGLLDETLAGNADYLGTQQLHDQAWPIVQRCLQEQIAEAARKYHHNVSLGKASNDIRQILPAAVQGRIDVLLIDRDAELWGTYRAESQSVRLTDRSDPEAEDLIESLAIQTLLHRGEVRAVSQLEMPASGPVAAVFRYGSS